LVRHDDIQSSGNQLLKSIPSAILCIGFVISVVYYYHMLLFVPPSRSIVRQTDSASMTLNLYQHGMKFFKPEVHSLTPMISPRDMLLPSTRAVFRGCPVLQEFGAQDYIYRMINT